MASVLDAVAPFALASQVPVVHAGAIEREFPAAAESFRQQLAAWGFMALEVPGVGHQINELYDAFRAACATQSPSLTDFHYVSVPQLPGGNHGFFPFASEVPRLAKGVADPKEFLHVSGAMLDDTPAGSGDIFRVFPTLGALARPLFELGFALAEQFGDLVASLISMAPPPLGLSRHSSVLRILHYRNVDGRDVLAHEHSGIQMLGIQFPPSDRGLQYILNDGTWVEPELTGTDVLLCNIGAMLTTASGGKFRSSTHRVHRKPPSDDYERWSAVLFVHPDHTGQQWTADADGSVDMRDATWGDFVSGILRGLGLTPGQAPD